MSHQAYSSGTAGHRGSGRKGKRGWGRHVAVGLHQDREGGEGGGEREGVGGKFKSLMLPWI